MLSPMIFVNLRLRKPSGPVSGTLVVGLSIFATMLLLSLVGLLHPPYSPDSISIAHRFQYPSALHWMGTDEYGRDVFSRVLVALGSDFIIGFGSVLLGVITGVMAGGIAAYVEGWLGEVFMRAMDATYSFPHLVLALLVITVMGPGELSSCVAIGVFNMPVFARLTYGLVMESKQLLYVRAARGMGASHVYVLAQHILLRVAPMLLVQATSSFSLAILTEASLSFLGLGIQPPAPSLGGMLNSFKDYLPEAPWLPIFPGIALILTVLGGNLLGDALEERLGRR